MFKKAVSLIMTTMIILSSTGLVACAKSPEKNSTKVESSTTSKTSNSPSATSSPKKTSTPKAKNSAKTNSNKTLVVYFSRSGNTKEVATYIAKQTGGDLYEIEPSKPYPTDYTEAGNIAKVERDKNERPAIGNLPASLDEYDTVLLGYPIWWHTAPMIIGTFLESYDFSGKEIYPFSQSASMDIEQFNASMKFIRTNVTGAIVHDGLFTSSSDTSSIDSYMLDNKLIKTKKMDSSSKGSNKGK